MQHTAPKFSLCPDGRSFVLCAPMVVSHGGSTFVVPPGFKTDLASIPRPLWPLYPPFGKWAAAAVIHDWLYWSGRFSRLYSDRCFLAAMAADGVPWFTRQLFFRAVRLFSGRIWQRYRMNQAEFERANPSR